MVGMLDTVGYATARMRHIDNRFLPNDGGNVVAAVLSRSHLSALMSFF